MQYFLQNSGFIFARNQKHNLRGAIDHGEGEGDAPCVKLFHPIGHNPPGILVERRAAGKQGSSVAVRSHAQHDEIKARPFAGSRLEKITQVVFVFGWQRRWRPTRRQYDECFAEESEFSTATFHWRRDSCCPGRPEERCARRRKRCESCPRATAEKNHPGPWRSRNGFPVELILQRAPRQSGRARQWLPERSGKIRLRLRG